MDAQHTSVVTWIANIVSGVTIISALTAIIPPVAAIVAVIWYVIQIKESTTYQGWLAKRRHTRLAKLRAEIAALEKTLPPPG